MTVQTEFDVSNLHDGYEFPYGFFITLRSDGGVDTEGTEDPSDDETIPARGTFNNDEARGIWVDLKDSFMVDGDAEQEGTPAAFLLAYLNTREFQWLPSNPSWDDVSPLLKDGVTSNPNYDPDNNPVDLEGQPVGVVGAMARHFDVDYEVYGNET